MDSENVTPEARVLRAMREENNGAPEQREAIIADRARLAQSIAQRRAEEEQSEMRRH